MPTLQSRLLMSAFLLTTLPLPAHDMWIEPATFFPISGDIIALKLRVGQDLLGDHDHRRKLPRRYIPESLTRNPAVSSSIQQEFTGSNLASTKEVMNDTVATESQGHPAIRHEPQSSPQ